MINLWNGFSFAATVLLIVGVVVVSRSIYKCKRKRTNYRQSCNTSIHNNSSIIMEAMDDTSVDELELTNIKVVKPMIKTD